MNTAVKLTSVALVGAAFLILNAAPAWAPRYGFTSHGDQPPAVASVTQGEWAQIKRFWKRTGKWAECNKQALQYKVSGQTRRSLVAACLKS